jgi:hypothetical protein
MFVTSLRRLALVIGLIGQVAPMAASPVSYDFTGTLSQPLYGATTFTGTLTYDTDLPAESQSPNYNIYSGVPLNSSEPVLSLTFTIGGVSSSAYGDVVNDNLSVSHVSSVTPPTPSADQFEIWEQFNTTMSAELILSNSNLVSRSPFTSVEPPASLNLSSFNLGGTLGISGYYNGQLVDELGTITSLTPVTTTSEPSSGGTGSTGTGSTGTGSTGTEPSSPGPVTTAPEPASLIVFASIGAAALYARRRSVRCAAAANP